MLEYCWLQAIEIVHECFEGGVFSNSVTAFRDKEFEFIADFSEAIIESWRSDIANIYIFKQLKAFSTKLLSFLVIQALYLAESFLKFVSESLMHVFVLGQIHAIGCQFDCLVENVLRNEAVPSQQVRWVEGKWNSLVVVNFSSIEEASWYFSDVSLADLIFKAALLVLDDFRVDKV